MKKVFYVLSLFCVLTGCQDKPSESSVVAETPVDENSHSTSKQALVQSDQGIVEHLDATTKVHEYPNQVLQYIEFRQQYCPPNKKLKPEQLVQVANILGDEQPEYILESNVIYCGNYASPNAHSATQQILVFATLKDGVTKRVFNHPMFDYDLVASKVKNDIAKNDTTTIQAQDSKLFDQQYRNSQILITEQSGTDQGDLTLKYPKQELWLTVGGAFCGQDMTQVNRTDAITCKREVLWDAQLQKMSLGKMTTNVQ